MASSIAGRSAYVRTIWRTSTLSSAKFSKSHPSISSNFMLRQTRVSLPSRFRRELSSLFPIHSATASACLVSKLPTEVSTSTQCRFANYVSPI
ncbi:hypothetical protein F0562_001903 [Nyssa sinensis]|uniref:Uncharacterized protein n=1 Tax=Nyssa sinensis TaxID=561372 RepID=A0A5J5C4Z6_9ASTE|nr:hypothetical protein F0562_001903 [Nyssa sinensis]